MASWLCVAVSVVCISFPSASPSESHVRKRSDDVSMETLMTAVSQLTEQVATMRAQMTAQQNGLSSVETSLSSLKQTVAFHAYSAAHVAATAHGAILLPTVQTNVGGGYDVRTGFFTAPVSGLYLFDAHFMCVDLNKYVHAAIYIDGAYIAGTISDCRHGFYDSVSTDTVVHINAGQKANLANSDDFPSTYYGYPYTTFSGFLLRAD